MREMQHDHRTAERGGKEVDLGIGRRTHRAMTGRSHLSGGESPYGGRMEFSGAELVWINNALAEVRGGPGAIEDREFHTRIGGERNEVRALLKKVHDEVDALGRASPEV